MLYVGDMPRSDRQYVVVRVEFAKKKCQENRDGERNQRRKSKKTSTAVKESWCRMMRGKRHRGISFAWRQHRFFFIDFLLLALNREKLEETGKEKEKEEEE